MQEQTSVDPALWENLEQPLPGEEGGPETIEALIEPEPVNGLPRPPMSETQLMAKAHLVLEDSEVEGLQWGMVKDCHGRINLIPKDADIVGTWARYGDGTYWVSITTPLEALRDRYTRLAEEIAISRAKDENFFTKKVKKSSTPRVPKEAKPPEPPQPTESAKVGNAARDLLSRLKK